ncbi:MAG: rhodanese-like domain-containing protein [Acidimicrobiales bacterium]
MNVALTTDDEDTFVDRILSGLTAHPAYYATWTHSIRAGAWPIDLSTPAPVDAAELGRRLHRGEWVVDLRGRRLFAADHVRGTINIELNDSFLTYLGWLIPWGIGLTLLAPTSEEITEAQRQLALIGIDRPRGAAAGRPNTWGDDRNNYPVTTFDHLDTYDGTVLDVRRPDERSTGAIDGSVHLPLDELLDSLDELPPGRLLVHCASGFRASIAASLLARAGRDVVLIDDSFDRERQ